LYKPSVADLKQMGSGIEARSAFLKYTGEAAWTAPVGQPNDFGQEIGQA
jgi:hypothetical protein